MSMCVVAVKHFEGVGWVGVKNRDRNYLANVRIVQSNAQGTQRLYLEDLDTHYAEGVNEHGLCIISASLTVKKDEKEVDKFRRGRADNYVSPDGRTIKQCLLLKDPRAALNLAIQRQLPGSTYFFNEKECYLLEGGFNVSKLKVDNPDDREYSHKAVRVNNFSVRTNHGILMPDLGYAKDSDEPESRRARKSSESRLEIASGAVKECGAALDMMDALSITPKRDPFLNPIRTGDPKKEDMVTTGQYMLIPKDRTMHYRPIFSDVEFKYSKLNGPESKTFFEIVTSKKLLGFKEQLLVTSHKHIY